MALDTEEYEQIETIKKWLRENGLFMIIAIVLAAGFLLGYQQWQSIHERDAVQASENYEQVLNTFSAKQYAAFDQSAQHLIKQYPSSTYAQLTQLLLAKRAIEQAAYPQAEHYLLSAVHDGRSPALKQISRLRLARLYLQIKAPEKALAILKSVDDKAYQADIKAVEGDVYVTLHNINAARANYQQALSSLPDEAILHTLVSMKLNDLPT